MMFPTWLGAMNRVRPSPENAPISAKPLFELFGIASIVSPCSVMRTTCCAVDRTIRPTDGSTIVNPPGCLGFHTNSAAPLVVDTRNTLPRSPGEFRMVK